MVAVAPPRAVVLSALAMLLIGFASISTLRSCVAAELIMINSPICEWCEKEGLPHPHEKKRLAAVSAAVLERGRKDS